MIFILVLTNIIANGIGAVLLITHHRNNNNNPQAIYLINLSILQVLLNLIEMLERIPEMISHTMELSSFWNNVQHYGTIVNLTGVWLARYLTIVYVTIDRFFMVRLGFKYQEYFQPKVAKYLVLVTWIITVFIPVSICIIDLFVDNFNHRKMFLL